MKTRRRVATVAAATAAFAMIGSTAFAHECMVMNRSEQSNKSLVNSPMWHAEDLATEASYQFVFQVVFETTGTPEELQAAIDAHIEQDLQRWAAFFSGHTLLQRQNTEPGTDTPAATKHAGDRKGVDHWSDTDVGQAMIAIVADIIAQRPVED